MRYLLLIAALAGCGHKGGTKPPAVPLQQVNALPDGPPLVTPGEHMTYRLSLKGLELASYEIAVGDAPADYNGRSTIVVQAHAKSVGLANFAVKVDDYFSSKIDVATGRSLLWQTDEFASNGTDKERVEAKLDARTADAVPMTFHLNDEPPTDEPQKVTAKELWDYNAFLVALRAWEGAIGSKVGVEVLRSRYVWHIDITLAAREPVKSDIGEFPAIRFDATTYKIGRDGQRVVGAEPRQFKIWISDEAGRVPLKITAVTDYGDIEMAIVDYQPGTGTRIRP